MIPATQPYEARFKTAHGGYSAEPVIAWNEDGEPLTVGKRGLRVVAINHPDFIALFPVLPPVVTVLPADGWRIEYDMDGTREHFPLLGFAIRDDGSVMPLEMDSDGHSWGDPRDNSNFSRLVRDGEQSHTGLSLTDDGATPKTA
ncbi:hypothetical protein ACIQWB_37720 [Streptomyces olivaceus]|uniref:hypothetical protein n=1 Tax=Streptomyces olivaceus TaxID=47716 RepID=UPI0038005653